MGAFYLVTSWALLVGWGTDDIKGLVGASENPVFRLAHNLWGSLWILVLFAVINSILAVSVACNNASTRVFYAMARSGSLPRSLAKVHPRYRTPVNAVTLQAVLLFAFGLGLGFWIGPDQEFFLMGIAITLGLVFVYGAGNLGVYRLYRGDHRSQYNPLLHLVFPLLSTVALIWVGYKSIEGLHILDLKDPIDYAPWIVVVWFVLGIALLAAMRARGQEEWLLRAGEVAALQEAPDRTAHPAGVDAPGGR
jgi:amino acid transporter